MGQVWSDRPSAKVLAAARSLLLARLPASDGRGAADGVALRIQCPAVQLAAALHDEPGFVWLDGAGVGPTLLAIDPVGVLFARGASTEFQRGDEKVRLPVDAFGAVEALLAVLPAGMRLFGFLGYELAALLEELPSFPVTDTAVPDLALGVYDTWLEGRGEQWRLIGTAAGGRLEILQARIEARLEEAAKVCEDRSIAPPARVTSEPDGPGFESAVRQTLQRIGAGEIFETNLCRRFSAPWSLRDAWTLYGRLRAASPAEYGAYLRLADAAVLSVSPECFLKLRGRVVESRPIKGTRPRPDPNQDAAVIAALQASEKDAAELAMIVDLVRNDLGRVSVPGSVAVREFAAPMVLPTVIHTAASVVAQLRENVGPTELLRATFPPGSITGAPKIQAMKVSAAEERCRRGPAMGAIGWIDAGGDMELSVAIRTAVVTADRVDYHAGGGIVADSDPSDEREETMAKAQAFLQALGVG
jgi:para-aminobenzoate synthetase component 1